MAAQNHGFAAPRERDDQILYFAATNWIKPRRRFIENHQVGIIDERLGESDAALHPFRELADGARLRRFQADHFQQLFRAPPPFIAGQVKKFSEKLQRLAGIEIAVKIRFFRQIADAFLRGDVFGRLAKNLDVTARRIEQTEQQLDGRGFARTVWAEQAEHFAAPHFKIYVVHRTRLVASPKILEHFRQPAHNDDIFRSPGGRRRWIDLRG